ncbi:MAG: putative sulfate exporter family transporter [Tissierellia bacterium]|nr:putative sulfate exporter family transporter [Tissierellia bacterium]
MDIIKTKQFWIAAFFTLLASLIGKYGSTLPGLRIIGAMVIALLVGMFYQLIPGVVKSSGAGVGFISGKFLRLGIILLGFKLNLIVLAQSGIKSLGLALFVVTFMIILTYVLCKKFNVHEELAILASCGCGICGAAAVMGVSPQIKAKSDDAVLSVAVVCIMGTVFTLISVGLREIMPLTTEQYAVLCGASLHEIAHAVAAAGAAGETAIDIAIVTKLSRVLLLAPVAMIAGTYYAKKTNVGEKADAKLPIPWFMVGFLIASAIGSFMHIDIKILDTLVSLAFILLGMAMAALGMSVNFKVIAQRGQAVFTAAAISSVVLYIVVFGIVKMFF